MQDGFWAQRRVLVTGHAGFLGRWLAATLADKGAVVIGFSKSRHDKLLYPLDTLPENFTPVQGQVENGGDISQAIRTYQIDSVFHLAAQAIVGEASKNPALTFDANIKGSWQVLDACRNSSSVTRVVLASTEKVYGNAQGKAFWTEDEALRADTPYAVSKACADMIAQMYHGFYGLPVGVARCSNLFGPGDNNFSRIIPGTIRTILNHKNPTILSDGSPMRDYVYVGDIVNGLLSLAEAMDKPNVQGRAFNFASGAGISVLDLTRQLLEVAGCGDLAPIVLNTAKPEEPQAMLSIRQSMDILGWKPKLSLRESLGETFRWYQQNL